MITVLFFATLTADARHPGRENLIGDVPDSLQMFGAVAYNSVADEYFAVYAGKNYLCGVRINPGGQILSNTRIGPEVGEDIAFNIPAVEYNSGTNSYLVTYRKAIVAQDGSNSVYFRFVGSDGAPISDEQLVTAQGSESNIAYNPVLRNYLVAWSRGFQHTDYRMVNGVPSNNAVLGQNRRVEDKGFRGDAAFSTGANKFLFVNAYEHTDGTNGSDIWGRFVTGDGTSVGNRFPIAKTGQDETGPSVAYAPSTNKWMVVWQRFVSPNRSFDVEAAFVDENGNIEKFYVVTTPLWDSPGDVIYNQFLDRFVVAWFAGSGPRLGLVNPHTGAFERIMPDDSITTPKLMAVGDGFNALATRPHPGNPQAFVYWREGHGLSGAYGTIVNLRTGDEIPVTGGGLACATAQQQPVSSAAPLPELSDSEETGPVILPPTPEPEPELKIEKFVRNVTEGQTASHHEILEIHPTDIIQFITLITSQADRTIDGLVVHDLLPDAMDFREGSTLIDGVSAPGRDIIEDGLRIGSIEAGETRTVRWSGQVRDVSALANGVNTLELPVVVTTDDAGTFFSNALLGLSDEFVAAQSTGVAEQAVQRGLVLRQEKDKPSVFDAGIPSTGAGGTALFALVGAVLASLIYAGYTRSGYFHRNQAKDVASRREPMDFRE